MPASGPLRPASAAVCLLLMLCSCASKPAALPRGPQQPAADAPRPAADAGFRKFTFTYTGGDDSRRERTVYLWYPSAAPASRFDYHGQIGSVAHEGPVAAGRHPLILFSHGFRGAGDQSIFLTEAWAREGYVVAAVDHADAAAQRDRPAAWPDFADAKTWDERKFVDRKEDLSALLDHLLSLDRDPDSFLHGRVDERAVGAAGHSLGGYTVLGMAGARPSWRDGRVRAALLMSPYAVPYLSQGDLGSVCVPVMLQGGTLDWGITPFLPSIFAKLPAPKYFLVLKGENHFGWTNLASLRKTTTEVVRGGNPELMTRYGVEFFNRHLKGAGDAALLDAPNPRLESYQSLGK